MEFWLVFVDDIFNFFNEGIEWLHRLEPEEFIRVFWAFLFVEVPRYLVTNIYVFFLYLKDSSLERDKTKEQPVYTINYPLVSVVISALNEEDTIAHTVESLREQDYPNIEIILVNDGSTDNTGKVMNELAGLPNIRCHHMAQRQGKSACLNYGVEISSGTYVVFLDSDTTFERNVVSNLVKYFKDPRIGAVSGNLRVRNWQDNILTRVQSIEYLISITVGRRFKSSAGILSIVPGAIGAFRRGLLARVGYMEPGPGNDSDATIRVRKLGMQVAFAHDATCFTNVPASFRKLIKQRLRWDRNIIRNRIRKHKDIFGITLAHFNWSNYISFLDTLIFIIIMPVTWVIYLIDTFINYSGEYDYILITIYVLHVLVNLVRTSIALAIVDRGEEKIGLLLWVPAYGVYRALLKIVRITSVIQEFFFRSSYRDPFAPQKVRDEMIVY